MGGQMQLIPLLGYIVASLKCTSNKAQFPGALSNVDLQVPVEQSSCQAWPDKVCVMEADI